MKERLQKIIARAGIASRRHAEDLIRSGQVRVNGVVVTELGAKADPEHDRVEAAGKVAEISEARVYLLMNKPPEVVSTLADPEGRRNLRNFLVGVSDRVFPVGSLDYAASGAILLTNDGDLASRMLKASASIPQTCWIKVKGRLNDTQMKTLANLVRGKVFPLRAPHAAGKNPPNPWYEAQITGFNRDTLRQNLLAIGHPVEKMKRMKLASLDVDTVPEGHSRELTSEEVAKLVRAVDFALKQPKPAFATPRPKREWRPRREVLAPKKTAKNGSVSAHKVPSHAAAKPGARPGQPPKYDQSQPPSRKPKSWHGQKSAQKPGSRPGQKPATPFRSKFRSKFRSQPDLRPRHR
jgi:23S rRNA pseudouridine2605 synthase